MSFDTKCHDLADVFVSDSLRMLPRSERDALTATLAQEIQDTIEGFLILEELRISRRPIDRNIGNPVRDES